MLLLLAAPGGQSDSLAARASADVVLVREGEVVDEDLYAGGNTITIEGVVEGDLVAWAFDRLVIDGTVEGDVIAYASSASINGTVGGSVRLVSPTARVGGSVGGDLFVIGWDVSASGEVGRDVLAWVNSLRTAGSIGRDIEGQMLGSVHVGGEVGRDVQVTVASLELTGDARVGQDVIYQARSDATIDAEAEVAGAVTRRAATVPNVRVSAVRLVSLVLAGLAFVWLGLLMLWVMPRTMERAVGAARTQPLRTLGAGLVALVVPLLAATAILTVAFLSPPDLAFVILGISAPIWLVLIGAVLGGILLAPVPIATALGRRILGRHRSAFAGYLFGIATYVLLIIVPILGPIVMAFTAVFGLGALARGVIDARGSLVWTAGEARAVERGSRRNRQNNRPRPRRLVDELEESDESDEEFFAGLAAVPSMTPDGSDDNEPDPGTMVQGAADPDRVNSDPVAPDGLDPEGSGSVGRDVPGVDRESPFAPDADSARPGPDGPVTEGSGTEGRGWESPDQADDEDPSDQQSD